MANVKILHLLSLEKTNVENGTRKQVFPGPAEKLWLSSLWDARGEEEARAFLLSFAWSQTDAREFVYV